MRILYIKQINKIVVVIKYIYNNIITPMYEVDD